MTYQEKMEEAYRLHPPAQLDYKEMMRRYLGRIIQEDKAEVRKALLSLAEELEEV